MLNFTERYLSIPVPAGINLPISTFSLIPTSGSTLPLIAASVRTLVVSWNEAADKNEFVAFVIPSIICVPVAGSLPCASSSSFTSLKLRTSTVVPGKNSESPAVSTLIFLSI